MTFNLVLLPDQERQRIELDKQAALLVWQCRRNLAAREDVARAIVNQPVEYQAYFRDRLNHYREVKGSHEQ